MSAAVKTILAVGSGPLLEPGVRVFGAHGLRTWQLVKPLVDAGHRIELFTIPLPDPTQDHLRHEAGVTEKQTADGFAYRAFRNANDGWNAVHLQETADRIRPDALLGINVHPSAVLAAVRTAAPMWADFYGSATIEGQMKSAMDGSDQPLADQWAREKLSLLRADRFSAVSNRQRWMMHGQLAALGRMNRHTFGHTFVDCIPAAYNPMFTEPAQASGQSLRKSKVPADAFLVLWSGGYNAWTNYDVLLTGLLAAMDRQPRILFVSTGGPVHGFFEEGYRKFVAAAEASPHRGRFHFLGWIDAALLPGVMSQCDLALQIDSQHFETVFGTRSRVLNMLAARLPVLTTPGTELSDELIAAGVVAACPQDEPAVFADEISALINDPDRLKALAQAGRDYCLTHFSYEATTRALVEWAADPRPAPDNLWNREHPVGQAPEPVIEARWKRAARGILRRRK